MKGRKIGMTRREVLRMGAAAAAGAAVGPFVVTPGHGQTFNWQRFKGKELFCIFYKHPWIDEMVKYFPEFTDLTGIKVNHEVLPEVQGRQKLVVEMTAGSGGVDAWHASMHVEKRRFWKSGWFQPLNKFLEDKSLTAPDYDWNDFTTGARSDVTQPDKTISAIPTFVDVFTLFYRKDLFQQKGIGIPRTMAELEDAAKKLHDPPRMYGFVSRGLKNANATPWAWVIYSLGGEYLTKDGKSAMGSPAWVKSLEWYAGVLRRYAPPGVVNFNWYECSSAFMQGQVVQYFDGVNFASQFEDKEKSKIAGKVGYTILPSGPGGHYSPIFGNAVAISSQSKNQGPAYFFAQWATSKQSAVKELLDGTGSARTSVWSDPEVKAKAKMPPDWYQAYQDSLKNGRLGLPEIVAVTEYRDIIGVAIQKAIEGA
ncbi:MAG TPA: sugar ABC transporter substrate-binding protein, partial [Candidatus Methylomirabilis sp.]|nr:sugar ABC transporter substrate-binding protein [Candidatus Methylomirabilis sp.]